MDIPLSVVEAVRETKADLVEQPSKRAPYVKKITKRILHAIGNGLRTPTSIANALNLPKAKIQSNLAHMKTRGLVYSHKQTNSNEHKYHITTDKPVLGKLDLTKPKRKYTKQVKVVSAVSAVEPTAKPSYVRQLENRVEELVATNNAIQAELIHAQAECFDLKAVVKYLERKGN